MGRGEGNVLAMSRSRKPFNMESDSGHHARYPVMRLRQAGGIS